MVSKFIQTVLCLSFFLMCSCVGLQGKLHPQVDSFIQLLVKSEEPTIAELEKVAGECGGDFELDFILDECRSKGWDILSQSCVNISRRRCNIADQETSLALNWLRENFSTVGKNHRLIDVHSSGVVDFKNDMVEVEIGKNKFLLFHNTHPDTPTGILVEVLKVNGKEINDLM